MALEIANYMRRGHATTEKLEAAMRYAKELTGLRNLVKLERNNICKIISDLDEKYKTGRLSSSGVNNHITSINNILKYAGKPELIVIAKDYGLSRKFTDGVNKENTREAAEKFKEWLNSKYEQTGKIKYKALCHAVNIQSTNLRLRESILVKLKDKDVSNNILKISDKTAKTGKWDGSKNTRARLITLNQGQKTALLEARAFMKENGLRNLNTLPTLKQGKEFAQNALKAFRKETGVYFHYHGERQHETHEAYSKAWKEKGFNGIECRARLEIADKKEWTNTMIEKTGLSSKEFKIIDKEIRREISRSLGHERLSITNRYLG
jgi:hypothetical protein